MKWGFFPLDEELGLLSGSLTPRLQGQVTQLGSWIPFGKVETLLVDLLGVHISEPTIRRCSEGHGAAYEAVQTAAVTVIERDLPEPPPGPAKQLLSVDGAMVPLVGGEWAEVKTLVIGDIQEPVLENSDTFQRLALVETQRRGVETAQQVVAVTDGAVWIQGFVDYHRVDAARVLDFGHAAEYVAVIGGVREETASDTGQAWLKASLQTLKHEGFAALEPELQAQVAAYPQQPERAEALTYLERRATLLCYPHFQAQGWPIGSGSVESGNKLVVEARLKGAGMHWARPHVNALLSLRWDEAWGEIKAHYQHQRQQRYRTRAQRHAVQVLAAALPTTPVTATPPPKTAPVTSPKSPWRPAPDHPWKRAPSCTPSRHA